MATRAEQRIVRAAGATVVAELVAARPDGELEVATVTPLVDEDGGIVVALPYAHRDLADGLVAARHLALVLSDDRMALRGWEPLVSPVRAEVDPDPKGDRFRDVLLDQELGKHPPSRLLADSLRDRRDHWWFLARLLCRLAPLGEVRPITARHDPTTGVLAWTSASGLEVETVAVVDADEGTCRLQTLSGRVLRGAGDPALLFRHDYSQPDLERRSELRESGRLEGGELRAVRREGELTLPDPPKLLERIHRHRAFAKACRRQLAAER
jgi:hypothetical protein